VDIVRLWQELGYIIIYVTGRPDMQLTRVVSWLAQVITVLHLNLSFQKSKNML